MEGFPVHLVKKEMVADGTQSFWFSVDQAGWTFEPGQNIDLTLIDPPETDDEGNKRTFSFASSPSHTGQFMIATRMRDTAYKRVLGAAQPGFTLNAVGPNGSMTWHEDTKRPAVFLAGGIGITPFHSMIEWACEQATDRPMTLIYSNRNEQSVAFHKDFLGWSLNRSSFVYAPIITDDPSAVAPFTTGRIDASTIIRLVSDLQAPIYYAAGPPQFVVAMRKMLLGLGVSKDAVRFESFAGY